MVGVYSLSLWLATLHCKALPLWLATFCCKALPLCSFAFLLLLQSFGPVSCNLCSVELYIFSIDSWLKWSYHEINLNTWLIRQINGADKQIAGLTPYLPWWCSQTSTVGFIPQGAAKCSQFSQAACPHSGVLTVRVEAGAWSRCLVWVLAPFPAKSHLEWL